MYMVNDDENAKDRPITDNEQALIVQGLRLLRAEKAKAYRTVRDAYEDAAPGLQPFREEDFGIPTIDGLITFIEGPDDEDEEGHP